MNEDNLLEQEYFEQFAGDTWRERRNPYLLPELKPRDLTPEESAFNAEFFANIKERMAAVRNGNQ